MIYTFVMPHSSHIDYIIVVGCNELIYKSNFENSREIYKSIRISSDKTLCSIHTNKK